jgi:hypothetical protein
VTAPDLARTTCALAAAQMLAGCEGSRPYTIGDPEAPPPPSGPFPRRITWSSESDWNPAFSFAGDRLLYSFAVPGRSDGDRCLAWLPAAGGRQERELCWRGGGDRDSTDVVVLGAESPGGRLAFVVERGRAGALVPTDRALLVTPPGRWTDAAVALTFPRPAGGLTWFGARDPTWLDDSTLVLVALLYAYSSTPNIDTTVSGIEIASLDLRATPPTLRVYPATRYASSVAPGPAPGTVIFTLGGDTRVYRLDLASGAQTVLYDFGALGIARDARLVGSTLVAVVGGAVTYGYESLYLMDVQRDRGGPVYAVDIAGAGPPVLLTPAANRFFRHLTLSPTATMVAAEGYAVTYVVTPFGVDTLVSETADLYLVAVP